jgi:hypothetical protein
MPLSVHDALGVLDAAFVRGFLSFGGSTFGAKKKAGDETQRAPRE